MQRNIYSLVVNDQFNKKHVILLKKYNESLKIYELTKKVPLKVINDFTTNFKSSEEIIEYLIKIGRLSEKISTDSEIYIVYVMNKQWKKFDVLFDNEFSKRVKLNNNKAIILNDKIVEELYAKIYELAMGNKVFRESFINSISSIHLKDKFIEQFKSGGLAYSIIDDLKNYRSFNDVLLFYEDFRKNSGKYYQKQNQEKEKMANLIESEILNYYCHNKASNEIEHYNDRLDECSFMPNSLFNELGEPNNFDEMENKKEYYLKLYDEANVDFYKKNKCKVLKL